MNPVDIYNRVELKGKKLEIFIWYNRGVNRMVNNTVYRSIMCAVNAIREHVMVRIDKSSKVS